MYLVSGLWILAHHTGPGISEIACLPAPGFPASFGGMKTSRLLSVTAVCGISLLILPGCNKRYITKIKQLEEEKSNLIEEHSTEIEKQEEEFRDKEDALEKAKEEVESKVDEITQERDRLNNDLEHAKSEIERLKKEIDDKTPKDASTPGHTEFNPAKEAKYSNAMATITGDASSGAGFIVEDGGKRYLYTTAAAISGNSRLAVTNAAGTKFAKFGNLELAAGCDFVRLELLEADDAPALQVAPSSYQVSTERRVSCLGINTTTNIVNGELINPFGQSADTIDLDPNLLVGKVSGPVIDTATVKVLAIVTPPATEQPDLWTPVASGNDVQFRAARINRDISWEPVPVATFLAEGKRIRDFDRYTKIVYAFAAMTLTPEGLGVENQVGNSETVKSVLADMKDLQVAGDAMALHNQLASKKGRIGEADLKKRVVGLFSTVDSQSKRNTVGFDPAKFSVYHRKAAEQSIKWRTEAAVQLQKTTEGVADIDLKPAGGSSSREKDREQDGKR